MSDGTNKRLGHSMHPLHQNGTVKGNLWLSPRASWAALIWQQARAAEACPSPLPGMAPECTLLWARAGLCQAAVASRLHTAHGTWSLTSSSVSARRDMTAEEGTHRERKAMKERKKLVLRSGKSHRKTCAFQLETNGTHLHAVAEPGHG